MFAARWTCAALVGSLALGACKLDIDSGALEGSPGPSAQGIIGGEVFAELPAVGSLSGCTGTLVGPRKVLTAAHCLDGRSADRVHFDIGVNRSEPEFSLRAASLHIHPGYDSTWLENDIGVIILAEDAPVEPLALVSRIDESWIGRSLRFVGYGHTDGVNRTGAGTKRSVWMPVTHVGPAFMNYGGTDKNTCFGDSGGPALLLAESGNYQVAGVTSYGTNSCQGYSGSSRVDVYRDFIASIGAEPGTDSGDACGTETYNGRCDGDKIVWCENGRVHSDSCAAVGRTCGWSEESSYFGCLIKPGSEGEGPCKGETYTGRCEGNVSVWCYQGKQPVYESCADWGKTCGWSSDHGYYDCLGTATGTSECGTETHRGRCDGDTLVWCDETQLVRDECAQLGMKCGWSEADGLFDCVAP